jgi:hypothetical protein
MEQSQVIDVRMMDSNLLLCPILHVLVVFELWCGNTEDLYRQTTSYQNGFQHFHAEGQSITTYKFFSFHKLNNIYSYYHTIVI